MRFLVLLPGNTGNVGTKEILWEEIVVVESRHGCFFCRDIMKTSSLFRTMGDADDRRLGVHGDAHRHHCVHNRICGRLHRYSACLRSTAPAQPRNKQVLTSDISNTNVPTISTNQDLVETPCRRKPAMKFSACEF